MDDSKEKCSKKTQSTAVTGFPGRCEQGMLSRVWCHQHCCFSPETFQGWAARAFPKSDVPIGQLSLLYVPSYTLKYSISAGDSGAPRAPQRGVPCTGNGCPLMDSPSIAWFYHSFLQLTASNMQLRLPPGTGLEQGTRKPSASLQGCRITHHVWGAEGAPSCHGAFGGQ